MRSAFGESADHSHFERHRSMFKLSLPFFLVASATAAQADSRPRPVTTIVLVHGAFAEGSSFDRITPLLEARGYNVVAVHMPLSSVEADVAVTRRAIDLAPGPVLLVAHSYGGFVATEAGTSDKVTGLVYIAALVPDNGESLNDLFKSKPLPNWFQTAVVDSGGFAWLPRATVASDFAQDMPAADIDLLTTKQAPFALRNLEDRVTVAAWHKKPSWFVRPDQDHIIDPGLQEIMAKRAGAKLLNLRSSHVVMLSHPRDVAAVILTAAAATK
jgi:pimeloyl-ACP methyl ester carboxylesterase